MTIDQWSSTASNNASGVTSVNWSEGQLPSTVNNSARQVMADVAAWRDRIGGGLDSTGSANVYALSTGTSMPSLADGRVVAFKANFSNTAAATLNVDSLGAKALRIQQTGGDAAVPANAIISGQIYVAYYSEDVNSAAGGWVVINPTVPGTVTTSTTAINQVEPGGLIFKAGGGMTNGGTGTLSVTFPTAFPTKGISANAIVVANAASNQDYAVTVVSLTASSMSVVVRLDTAGTITTPAVAVYWQAWGD